MESKAGEGVGAGAGVGLRVRQRGSKAELGRWGG